MGWIKRYLYSRLVRLAIKPNDEFYISLDEQEIHF